MDCHIQVDIDGNIEGGTFEGIGGITSNGMSKLLMDYPAAQRDDILNFLFKPNFGAGLQHLKVEIGSDVNTSCGTEPSHMRTETDFDITRGYGLVIAQKAREINPDIYLDALRWGTPRWITDDNKKYLYYRNFLQGARDVYGLEFDYLGPDINEGAFSRDWTVNTLRPGLDRDGFSKIKLIAADNDKGWDIADMAAVDEELSDALYAMGVHYMQESSENALKSGKHLWLSEGLAPFRHSFKGGALDVGHSIIRMYALGKMVKYEMHPLIEAEYATTPFNYKGILTAVWPWTGHYEVEAGLWIIAHFTQFAKPGWKYIDSGSGCDDDGGYITLKKPGSCDYSIVIVNKAECRKEYVFLLPEEISGLGFHVWKTDKEEHFVKTVFLEPVDKKLYFTTEPCTIYSLTTTTGQRKGRPANTISEETCFQLPYKDDFSSYDSGRLPRYTLDQGGAFEAEYVDGAECLCQKITADIKPLDWTYRSTPQPYTLLGSLEWADYRIKADVRLGVKAEYAMICGRVNNTSKNDMPPQGYALYIKNCGSWELKKGIQLIKYGKLEKFVADEWNTLELGFSGANITGYINDKEVLKATDGEISSGQIALGCSYHSVQFANLAVTSFDKKESVSCKRYDDKDSLIYYSQGWTNDDGNFNNFKRSLKKSCVKDAYARLEFNGTGVCIIGRRDEDCGMADIYLDGIHAGTVDMYKEIQEYRMSLFSSYGLQSGNHEIRLVVSSCKNAFSKGTNFYLDAVEIIAGSGLV